MKRFVLVVLFFMASTSAYSGFQTGNSLIDGIKEYDGSIARFDGAVFMGYVMSVYDVLETLHSICPPTTIEGAQVFAVTENYIKQNPARWHENATILISEALMKSFPCKK
jgi:formylmethanofuran:tetrahydromethanopterin formyltransferase